MDYYQWQGERLYLELQVVPRAARDAFGEVLQDEGSGACRIKLRITAPPVDGKANRHLLRFLAKMFKVPTNRITLVSGENGRRKRVCIERPGRLPAELNLDRS